MDPSLVDNEPREARMLAAIVFTDVVGFSKLAAQNEARVYVALQRDMAVMTNLCRAHGGQVLNTMGDGMLLYFGSAVDALGCAVEIQQTLYNQSLTLPPVEVLQHRIGVHLGDVIMSGDNVFGDGVNIAARLQTMAKPGAICFSGTVSDVVKNKLTVDATYLGPQSLKNISERVKVWQVPPLGEKKPDLFDPLPNPMPPEPLKDARGTKAGLLVLASGLLIGMLIFGIARVKPMGKQSLLPPSKRHGKMASTNSTPTSSPGGDTGSDQVGETTGNDPNLRDLPSDDLRRQIHDLRQQYKFDEIVGLLNKSGEEVPAEMGKIETYRRLSELETFLDQSLQVANVSNPIQVPSLDDLKLPQSPLPAQVYMEGDELAIQTNEGRAPVVPLAQLTPMQYLEIATAAVNAPMPGTQASPDLPSYLQTFSTEFGVTMPASSGGNTAS